MTMSRRKLTVFALTAVLILVFAAAGVSARGNSDSAPEPKPEPIPVKDSGTGSKSAEAADMASSYPPAGWVTDIGEAYRLAQKDDKDILINFTGSDWCVWCKKLSSEVFNTDEFKAYADKNLVLLFLDFPSSINLPEKQVYHNQLIAQLLGVQGYPSIWLMDKELNPQMVTGYQPGGADEYIRHLEEDLPEVADDEREAFRLAFTEAVESNLGPLNRAE